MLAPARLWSCPSLRRSRQPRARSDRLGAKRFQVSEARLATQRLEAVEPAVEELERVQDLLLQELRARYRVALPLAVLAVRIHLGGEVFDQPELVAAVAIVDRGRGPAAQVQHPA